MGIIKNELKDIIIDDIRFKESASKSVVMVIKASHITMVDGNGVCNTSPTENTLKRCAALLEYIAVPTRASAIKGGSLLGYWSDYMFTGEYVAPKWEMAAFVVKDIIKNKNNEIGVIIQTLDTEYGRKLADRLVYNKEEISLIFRVAGSQTLDSDVIIKEILHLDIV